MNLNIVVDGPEETCEVRSIPLTSDPCLEAGDLSQETGNAAEDVDVGFLLEASLQ
jgi:hypothetical protein